MYHKPAVPFCLPENALRHLCITSEVSWPKPAHDAFKCVQDDALDEGGKSAPGPRIGRASFSPLTLL